MVNFKRGLLKWVIIAAAMTLLAGCAGLTDAKNNAPANDKKPAETSAQTNTAPAATDSNSSTANKKSSVIIKGYYDEPASIKDKNTIILEGVSKGEYIEIIIQGEVQDFQHIKVEWDTGKNDLVEKGIINKFENLKNKTIVIKTYMPEGIPSEKVKWKSVTGKVYEYIIKDNSLGDKKDAQKVIYLE